MSTHEVRYPIAADLESSHFQFMFLKSTSFRMANTNDCDVLTKIQVVCLWLVTPSFEWNQHETSSGDSYTSQTQA